MQQKLRAGVIGATGMVGQRFLTLLANHPYFEVTALMGSSWSAGKPYAQAVEGRWKLMCPCRNNTGYDGAGRQRC